jgi:hypothetical protein
MPQNFINSNKNLKKKNPCAHIENENKANIEISTCKSKRNHSNKRKLIP